MILKDLKMIYPSLYDLFNQNFSSFGTKKFARIAFEYAKMSSEVNKDFHAIIIINKKKIEKMKLDPPFLNRFEKHIIDFSILLEERDIKIATNIIEYLDSISSFNGDEKLKINLEKLLINCKQHNIEGLIFKIKNEGEKSDNKNKDWLNKKGEIYEEMMTKEIFKIIVPTFCQDIITAIANLDLPKTNFNKIILEIYKENHYNNFNSFLKKTEKRKNIIYTFSKVTCDFFNDESIIKNKFGIFTNQSIEYEMAESIKAEKDLDALLKNFNNSNNKNLLILRFTEEDLNNMDYINFVITDYEKENKNLMKKVIIFLVHKRRLPKNIKQENKSKLSEGISFINDEYYQIFIDNLQGKEELNILDLIQKNNTELVNEYIDNFNFLENQIFNALNYLNCQILYETQDFNSKNYISQLSEKILNNETIKRFILNNIKEQGKSSNNNIKDIFIKDNVEINDIDFFEIINTKLNRIFFKYLLNIIVYSLEEGILFPLLVENNYEILKENFFLDNLIHHHFQNTQFKKKLIMKFNKNKVTIYNGLQVQKCKINFDSIINYINKEIIFRYTKNEESLRKTIKNEDIKDKTDKYNENVKLFKLNIQTYINNKCELIKAIFDEHNHIELKKMLFEDYLKYFIIKYIEKRKTNYQINKKLFSLLNLIIKVKLSDSCENLNDINNFNFQYSIDEFIEIILFTQGYKKDIINIFEVYLDMIKFNGKFEQDVDKIICENRMKYEISKRNEGYTKIVNISLFKIVEAIIRASLINCKELIKIDKIKFLEYLSVLPAMEAILRKINRTYNLFSKEIYSLRNIIKINETFKFTEKVFEQIIINLLEQSNLFYEDQYKQLYNSTIELINIIDKNFKEKNEEYGDLLFSIFLQQYRNISDEKIRVNLLEAFFNNKMLLKKSKLFLAEILRDFKPEIPKDQSKEQKCIDNFMNLDNSKFTKYNNIINICNKFKSKELN